MGLKAELREKTGSGASTRDRNEGRLPAVIYGHGAEPQNVTLDSLEVGLLIRDQGENAVFDVDVNGKKQQVLLKGIQRSAIKRQLLSVDLQTITAGEKITVNIPVVLEDGPSRTLGTVEQHLSEVEVKTTPNNIPSEFVLDTSNLEIGDNLTVADLTIPADIEVVTDPTYTVASVAAPQAEEEEETTAGDEVSEPEVIGEADEEE